VSEQKSLATVKIEDLRVFSGSANQPLAEAVTRQLGIELSSITITHLPVFYSSPARLPTPQGWPLEWPQWSRTFSAAPGGV